MARSIIPIPDWINRLRNNFSETKMFARNLQHLGELEDRGGPVRLNNFPGFLSEASALGYAAAGSCCGVK